MFLFSIFLTILILFKVDSTYYDYDNGYGDNWDQGDKCRGLETRLKPARYVLCVFFYSYSILIVFIAYSTYYSNDDDSWDQGDGATARDCDVSRALGMCFIYF